MTPEHSRCVHCGLKITKFEEAGAWSHENGIPECSVVATPRWEANHASLLVAATTPPGPCSACGDGDTALQYHNHDAPMLPTPPALDWAIAIVKSCFPDERLVRASTVIFALENRQQCGHYCVATTPAPADVPPPLCPVHARVDELGKLEMTIGGLGCVACSLTEREELLAMLAPFAPKDGMKDSGRARLPGGRSGYVG